MPAFQFYSPEADDAKWLIWGKILHRKGTRGTRYPESNVRVQITDTAIRVSRDLQTFYYSGSVALPCQCRTLSILAFNLLRYSDTLIDSHIEIIDGTQWSFVTWQRSYTILSITGEVVASGSGTSYTESTPSFWMHPIYGPTSINQTTFSNYAVGTGVKSGVVTHWLHGGGSTAPPDSDTTAFQGLGAGITYIVLSDGTPIASAAYDFDDAGFRVNYPLTTTWGGDGWVQLANSSSETGWTDGGRITFDVPEDVCFAPAAVPVLPGGAAAAFPAWATDWAAAQAAAIVRERARRKACSDNLKANLKAGILRDQVNAALRPAHPLSANTYQAALMTATFTTGSSGSGDDVTNTRTVTLRYLGVDNDGNPTTLEEVIEGTQHIVVTRCANSSGAPNAANYTTITYTNWLPVDSNGSTGSVLDYTYQQDGSPGDGEDIDETPITGMCQIQNGVVVVGASSITATFDTLGQPYSPPYLMSSDSRTITYPQLYIDYRMTTARKYGVGLGSTAWLDSVFKTGETIDIFPLSVIHSEYGDLGAFPQSTDLSDTAKLTFRVDMKSTYSYNYKLGTWTGIGADLASPISIPYVAAGTNIVFRSHAVPWPDLRGPGDPLDPNTYEGQKVNMAMNPGGYPLFVPLLTV